MKLSVTKYKILNVMVFSQFKRLCILRYQVQSYFSPKSEYIRNPSIPLNLVAIAHLIL